MPNKVLILTTQDQLATAHNWIDNTLPTIYLQHIDDKLDVTMLCHLVPYHLDKLILMAASTMYADKLKICTATTLMNHLQATKYVKPPINPHNHWVDMTFEETASKQSTTAPSSTQNSPNQTQDAQQNSATANTPTATPVYYYKVELNHFSIEIEQNLMKHFEAIFAQMESKIDSWIKKQDKWYAEQENTNAAIAKQLTFLFDNMKKFLKYTTPTIPHNTPSPWGEGQL